MIKKSRKNTSLPYREKNLFIGGPGNKSLYRETPGRIGMVDMYALTLIRQKVSTNIRLYLKLQKLKCCSLPSRKWWRSFFFHAKGMHYS